MLGGGLRDFDVERRLCGDSACTSATCRIPGPNHTGSRKSAGGIAACRTISAMTRFVLGIDRLLDTIESAAMTAPRASPYRRVD
jgi:hypothetical protein